MQNVINALVAEFKAAVVAASNAGETGRRAEEEAAFTAQGVVNSLALRLGVVDEVEKMISRELRLTGFVLSRDPEEVRL